MPQMTMYPVFAGWAKKHGLQAAVDRFAAALPNDVEGFRLLFNKDLQKVAAGGPPIITAGGDEWYSGPGEDDLYWPALRGELAGPSNGWPKDRIEAVDAASSTVLAHTPNPSRKAWSARGLVVGYVQSGKTTNFTSVIAKAADEDYRLIIVLSGIHNGLRKQTQQRLDQQLKKLNDDRWWTLTEEAHDFLIPTWEPSASLTSDKVVLAVVKKNATVLTRLVNWLGRENGRRELRNARVLVIDDEADQASVATGRINPLIMKLLNLMPKATYIGYTATPFANVFIDPTDENDLYPKDFILNLPRPEGYFGPEKLFGRDLVEGEDTGVAPDGYDMVRTVPESDLPLLRPTGRRSAADFVPTMTAELEESVRWFWLATAARRARNDLDHSTMLVHTSMKTDVHESFRPLFDSLCELALDELDTGNPSQLDRWRILWDKESSRVPASDWGREQNTFEEVLPHLRGVVAQTRVVLDNYRSLDRLDYSKDPVVAIAVGGNTLSRGLTLVGLVVSFFVRGATAYDTLLQMGRWFGFRSGYEDLPRIWMTPALESAFRHLATVEHEMRDDIDRYQRENLTPIDIAVRIKTHPSLRITAKMGAAQPTYISYAGRRLQTRYFPVSDPEWIRSNLEAAAGLVQDATRHGDHERNDQLQLFRNVPVGSIKNFLSAYAVHKDSPDLDSSPMLKYIDRQLGSDTPALLDWTVAVVGGEKAEVDLGGIRVGTIVRSRLSRSTPDRADIKTLMSRRDRGLDLDLTPGEALDASESALAKKRNEDPVHRTRGLLVLYPINARSAPQDPRSTAGPEPVRVPLDAPDTVIGMGIVFPGDAELKNRLRATHVAVDLTDVERTDINEALDNDTEDPDAGV
jgi:Z1 domain